MLHGLRSTSVIVIEHDQVVMAHADRIIDLGPGAGHDGGRVVFEGTPADLVAARSTLTGEHLVAFAGSWTEALANIVTGAGRAPEWPGATATGRKAARPSAPFASPRPADQLSRPASLWAFPTAP
jgi:hypothetical protein